VVFHSGQMPVFIAICRIFVEDDPPFKNLDPLFFLRGICILAGG